MVYKKRSKQRKSPQSRMVIHDRRGDDALLKEKIMALDGFPDLKVKDWMSTAMAHYNLYDKLPMFYHYLCLEGLSKFRFFKKATRIG